MNTASLPEPPQYTTREKLEAALGLVVSSLPNGLARVLAGKPTVVEGRTLDPHAQLLLRLSERVKTKRSEVPLEVARRGMDVTASQLSQTRRPAVDVETTTLAGRGARIYRARDQRSRAGIVYFHGGGFMLGSPNSHDYPCRLLAEKMGATVFSVDYRLAPEHPFPAAVDDATAATLEVGRRAEELGLEADKIVVSGDSAGGCLAIIAALEADDAGCKLAAVLTVYPGVDFTMSMPSLQTLGRSFFLERDDILFYRKNYLQGADEKHPRASPFFRTDLQRMPPTVLVTAGFDPLRDEGDRFAGMLGEAGVEVSHLSFPELFHGFWNTSALPAAKRAFDLTIEALKERLAQSK